MQLRLRVRNAVIPLLAMLAVGAVFVLQAHLSGPWSTALLLLVLMIPIWAFGTYRATLGRITKLVAYSERSVFRRVFSGPLLSLLVNGVFALLLAINIPVQLIGFGRTDWFLLGFALTCFLGVWWLAVWPLAGEWRQYCRLGRSLSMAAWIAAALLVAFEVVLVMATSGVPRYPSLRDAIEAGRQGASLLGDSSIAAALSVLGGMTNGVQAYALGILAEGGWGAGSNLAAAAVSALLAFAFYLAVCLYMASFLVPVREYRRCLGPLIDSDDPPPVSKRTWFAASVIFVLIVLFILPYLVLLTETKLRQYPGVQQQLERAQTRIERIDDTFVREGTIAEITQVRLDTLSLADPTAMLEDALDAGFDGMITNVDGYLDWYYSLPAEWGRIGRMLVGDLEAHMAAKLAETLSAGNPFGALDAALAKANNLNAQAHAEMMREVETIIARNRVEPGAMRVVVVGSAERDSLTQLFSPQGTVALNQRVGAGTAAAVISGAIAAKVVGKVLAKGTIKMGATALVKVLGGKAVGGVAGAATGALAGGALGSVIPIIGTVVGAVIGGAVTGLAIGVGVDALVLQLEEQLSRESMRADLVAAIDAEREDMRALLNQVRVE